MLNHYDLIKFKRYVEDELYDRQRALPMLQEKNPDMAKYIKYQIQENMGLLYRIKKEILKHGSV